MTQGQVTTRRADGSVVRRPTPMLRCVLRKRRHGTWLAAACFVGRPCGGRRQCLLQNLAAPQTVGAHIRIGDVELHESAVDRRLGEKVLDVLPLPLEREGQTGVDPFGKQVERFERAGGVKLQLHGAGRQIEVHYLAG